MSAVELGEAVAARVRALPGWPEFKTPAGYPNSAALCVVDAIWSMGVRYAGVENVLAKYKGWLDETDRGPAASRSATELVDDVKEIGGDEKFADVVGNRGRTSTRHGILKSSAVLDAAQKLSQLGIDHASDLRDRHGDADVEAAWRSVKGQRSGISWHYLLVLAGVEDVKPDRMICRFVGAAADGKPVTSAVAYRAVHEAHAMLAKEHPLTLRQLDHAMWSEQRRHSAN